MTGWDMLTRGQQDDHRNVCHDSCDLCDGHRVCCYSCGHDVDPDDINCGSCGEHAPASIDWGTR